MFIPYHSSLYHPSPEIRGALLFPSFIDLLDAEPAKIDFDCMYVWVFPENVVEREEKNIENVS